MSETIPPTGPLRLTYAELAQRLGVSVDGARTRARRRGWPVSLGNDGKAMVTVAEGDLQEVLNRATGERPPSDQALLTEQGAVATSHLLTLVTALQEDLKEAMASYATEAARAAAAESALAEVRDALAHEREVNAELRRPWWVRWWPR
ncbi:MAG TPA: hypothetical protein VHL31_26405 [Geminicoccus sp.]|jgi:hypothetical protein|uniref:hypothetical protein n=1 Tax=Geminicoccus sp. TaxID=2024832 RepID=UPI002E33A21A|nr:hypothetical protein [Geminicoccus sp.]HEX2529810.1 hypothetical protein [Geminicoccus sp.]